MLWEAASQLTDLPPISRETRRFIALFLEVDQDVLLLAARLDRDFFDVVSQLSDPVTTAWISAINALKNNERRERALRTLDAALTNEHRPAAVHRAASRILRHMELTRPRAVQVRGSPRTRRAGSDQRPQVLPTDQPLHRDAEAGRSERSAPNLMRIPSHDLATLPAHDPITQSLDKPHHLVTAQSRGTDCLCHRPEGSRAPPMPCRRRRSRCPPAQASLPHRCPVLIVEPHDPNGPARDVETAKE